MSGETQDIPMPQIGDDEEVEEATLVAWLKQVGDEVAAGEAVAEAMTEKINVEIESPVAGVLEEILVEEDHTVAVGQSIARVIPSA
jgi:pyruvate dehydrogenase E2 component (dihydrolipoamide acetyltransferase)